MSATLLVVDDAPAVRDLLCDFLSAQGYRVFGAASGEQALELAERHRPDLLLLDVMMPGLNGLDVIRRLRRDSDVPIILLTARVDESDRIAGLDLGADDYVTKPFSLHEVDARIRAVLRRTQRTDEPSGLLTGGAVTLDPERFEVTVDGNTIHLTRSEFAVLHALMQANGRVLSRLDLMETLGSPDNGSTRTVDVHVRNLRVKIERDPAAPERISTVTGVGYRFAP